MNRADETFQVSEMISRYVLGSMTESEKEELNGWLDKSPRNKLLFEELVCQEVASGKILAYGRVEWEDALKELLEQKKKLRLAGRKGELSVWEVVRPCCYLPVWAFGFIIFRREMPRSGKDRNTRRFRNYWQESRGQRCN